MQMTMDGFFYTFYKGKKKDPLPFEKSYSEDDSGNKLQVHV